MYDGCPPADPRSNASLIPLSLSLALPSPPLSVSRLCTFLLSLSSNLLSSLSSHVCSLTSARFMARRYAEKDTDRLEVFYDQRHATSSSNVSPFCIPRAAEVTRCIGREDDSLAARFQLRTDRTGAMAVRIK